MSVRIARSLVAIVAAATAQAPAEFEVASIKPNRLNDRIVSISVGPGDKFTARGYTLVLLMQRAYGVMDWNVTGGPAWIRSDRWDVAAKAPVNLTEWRLRPMLQTLLAERFKLKVHKDSKEMPGYALVVARGGPKVKAFAGEENPDAFRMNQMGLTGQVTMEDFARYVAGKLGLVAVDKTGLKGLYNFTAHWKEETDPNPGGLPGMDPRDGQRSAVFTALEDQLGLKLVPQKITVQMLVIDSVEKALEN